MKKIIFLPVIFFACENRKAEHISTIKVLEKTIDQCLQKKADHLNFYLSVNTPELKQLMECSKEINQIINDSTTKSNVDLKVKDLVRSKYKTSIWYEDWTSNIDSTLAGTDLKINILVNELSFINSTLDLLEKEREYSFKTIGYLTKVDKNVTQVYLTAVMRYPFAEFLFPYTMSDSLKSGYKGVTDTMRIVGRQSGDHYTIINKDGMNYQYVLKFPKADGTYEYFNTKAN